MSESKTAALLQVATIDSAAIGQFGLCQQLFRHLLQLSKPPLLASQRLLSLQIAALFQQTHSLGSAG